MENFLTFSFNETTIRLAAFLGIFLIMALCERAVPRRRLTESTGKRWINNLSLIGINTLIVRLLPVAVPVAAARLAETSGAGLLHYFGITGPVAIVLSIIFLDMVIYFQHLAFHAVPLLWRLHMVHHADLEIDVTTGLRFHPVEILISLGIKGGAVYLIGAPVLAVVFFEVILNGTSLFNHSNISLPLSLDRLLRAFLVTPDMHRVHHSVIIKETNSNFGFSLTWWDYIFGTYRAQPQAGHTDMVIGLSQFRDREKLTLPHLIIQPFRGDPGRYPIGR